MKLNKLSRNEMIKANGGNLSEAPGVILPIYPDCILRPVEENPFETTNTLNL